ncbi:hypothetical protein EK21DRAFT_107021 [Setomelanomma holmii]|uniref:Ankyrin repeat protein n=1 Tax=Setomelanomma holmii TaxID=210430 RepID=A0A9P4HL28_9PLEO|nr:hypothetical protein EK21DRAFT_107021 [Setomelanomma holmii]
MLSCPKILRITKDSQTLILEAAASLEDLGMFNFLKAKGFNLNILNLWGIGSAVAAAANNSSTKLIIQLLDTHVDINGIAFGLGSSDLDGEFFIPEKRLKGIHGFAALHVAVRNNDEMLTRLLLYYGANANQYCCVYPYNWLLGMVKS